MKTTTALRQAMHIIVLAALLLAVTVAVQADGPVIWKHQCPRHHDVVTVPDLDGDGVHVLCIRAAERTK